MQIIFEMSGGYGGLFAKRPLSYRVNTDDLARPEREKLLELIGASGVLVREAEDSAAAAPGRPDLLRYKLSVVGDGQSRSCVFDDRSVPSAMRSLLQYLQECAIKARTKSG